MQKTYYIIVVEKDGEVLAFAATSTYRPRACYAGVAEFSVYVARARRGCGCGKLALSFLLAAARSDHFDVALVFSTKYEPPNPLLDRWNRWIEWKKRFFGFHRDLPPAASARILNGRVVFSEERKGQWVAVLEMQREEWMNAKN